MSQPVIRGSLAKMMACRCRASWKSHYHLARPRRGAQPIYVRPLRRWRRCFAVCAAWVAGRSGAMSTVTAAPEEWRTQGSNQFVQEYLYDLCGAQKRRRPTVRCLLVSLRAASYDGGPTASTAPARRPAEFYGPASCRGLAAAALRGQPASPGTPARCTLNTAHCSERRCHRRRRGTAPFH